MQHIIWTWKPAGKAWVILVCTTLESGHYFPPSTAMMHQPCQSVSEAQSTKVKKGTSVHIASYAIHDSPCMSSMALRTQKLAVSFWDKTNVLANQHFILLATFYGAACNSIWTYISMCTRCSQDEMLVGMRYMWYTGEGPNSCLCNAIEGMQGLHQVACLAMLTVVVCTCAPSPHRASQHQDKMSGGMQICGISGLELYSMHRVAIVCPTCRGPSMGRLESMSQHTTNGTGVKVMCSQQWCDQYTSS